MSLPRWLRANLRALTWDLAILLQLHLLGLLAPAAGSRSLSQGAAVALAMLLQLVLPIDVARTIHAFRSHGLDATPALGRTGAGIYFALTGVMLYLAGFALVGRSGALDGVAAVGLGVGGATALGAGFLIGARLLGRGGEQPPHELGGQAGLLLGVAAIPVGIFAAFWFGWGFGRTLGLIAAALALPAAVGAGLGFLVGLAARRRLGRVLVEVGLGAAGAAAVGLWLDLLLEATAASSLGGRLLVLVLTGYLPLRLAKELEPPFSLVSVLSGLLALGSLARALLAA